jgi:hypothetical protein
MALASPHPLSPAKTGSAHASDSSPALSALPAVRDVGMLELLCIKAEVEAAKKYKQHKI